MQAKWVGRYRELSGSELDPPMADAVEALSPAQASAVAAYLRSGIGLIDVLERRSDVLDGSPVDASASLLGDGVWIWREDLAYYVEKYRIGLDPEFLATVGRPIDQPDEQQLAEFIGAAVRAWTDRSG